ncbi:MAG: ABC transporter ATP-binding protein [Alphaproteobacteria bacterium]|nr:ABC transporter ATP-binding protein [Alphaproteobacteria bacterium]
MSFLTVEGLSVTLGQVKILEDVTFQVPAGKVTGLIGANGAGKSTALKAILDIVTPSGGKITLDGVDVPSMAARERARLISYVPQGAPVHWPLAAERLVALGRIPHLNPWQELSDADNYVIQQSMEATDCWRFRDRSVTSLSGGERSRVLLARTMAVGAPYMLADEPIASLDPLHQLQVMDIMRQQAAKGVGVLIVLHDLSFALRFCDQLVLLHAGGVLASGQPDEVLADKNMESAFGVQVSRWSDGGEQFLVPRQMGQM